jgi:hypothetical protein
VGVEAGTAALSMYVPVVDIIHFARRTDEDSGCEPEDEIIEEEGDTDDQPATLTIPTTKAYAS